MPEITSEKESEDSSETNKNSKEKKLDPEKLKARVEILEKILKYGSNKERKEVLRDLSRIPKESCEKFIPILKEILSPDQEASMKISALRAVSEIGLVELKDSVIASLKHESDDVKEHAVYAVKKMNLKEALPTVFAQVKERDFSKLQNATSAMINVLGDLEYGGEASVFLLGKFREKNTNTDLKSQLALYLGKVKEKGAEKDLIDLMNSDYEDVNLRAYSIHALGKIGLSSSVQPVKDFLKKIKDTKNKSDIKRFSPLKIYAIAMLASSGDKEILQELKSFARDDDPNVRIKVIRMLGDIKEKSALELLEYKAERDPSAKVQAAAKKAIEEITGEKYSKDKKKNTSEKKSGNEKDQPKK